ncbi:MAG: HAD hydrolase family protein [Deltaproteobacteria bacterium]|jgi:hydroxymethylpyrimidine pyrophosphatase-like HAD family hydrolase|nr:HAD hydrolase family protein [Deltaproteobacteria bacterium]
MESELFKGPIPKTVRIVFMDFDGTIKPSGAPVSKPDVTASKKLGHLGLIRVVATGRGLYSFQRDYPDGFELDYLLFSSGLGLCPWKGGPGPLALSGRFDRTDRDRALAACLALKRGFLAFEPPPRCHYHAFQYPEGHRPTEGFMKRLSSYVQFTRPYQPNVDLGPVSEFLIPTPSRQALEIMADFEKLCPGLSVLRSSSPFGDDSVWLEIFPPGFSKGQTAKILADSLSLNASHALALGNDYNDLDLLDWAGLGLVTSNAPASLRAEYASIPAVTEKPLNYLYKLIAKSRKG